MNTFQRVGLTLGWLAFVAMWCADWRAGATVMAGAVLFASGLLGRRVGQERRERAARREARRLVPRPATDLTAPVADHVMGRCVTMKMAIGDRTGARLGVVQFGDRVFMGKFESDDVSARRAEKYRWN